MAYGHYSKFIGGMEPLITSTSNPKIKALVALSKPQVRKQSGYFIMEGAREVEKAIRAGYEFREVYICKELCSDTLASLLKKNKAKVTYISKNVFDSLAYREDSGGIIATACMRSHLLEELKMNADPLILVIENVEKPGNIGGILRTADAAAVDAILVCNNQTDLYNPNVIRSSLGTIFTNKIALCTTRDAINWLKKNQIKIYSSSPAATSWYYDPDYRGACAVVLGSEAEGMSNSWFKEADLLIKIPMLGIADSLNVSVSGAIIIFEAIRQRMVKK